MDPALVPPGEPGQRDWGRHAFEAATAHLEAVEQAFWCQQGECEVESHTGEEGAPSCPDPAKGIGCQQCTDCTVREVLAVTWPIIEAAIRSGDFDEPVVSSTDTGH